MVELGTTGTLSLVHYVHHDRSVLCIEWKPNDFLIADADANETGEWSLVDTISKRQRTASECLVFNTHTDTVTTRNSTSPGISPIPPPVLPTKTRIIRVKICDLRHIELMKKGHLVRLVTKADGKTHSEYFFQHGNADGFVRGLQTTHCLRRSSNKRDLFEIVDNIEHDNEKLRKTFAELKIEDIKGSGGTTWISSMVRDPFGQTMGFLAKMSDAYAVFPGVSDTGAIGVSGTRSGYSSPIGNEVFGSSTSTADEYEVLGTSPRQSSDDDNHIKELEDHLPPRPKVVRGSPLTQKQWGEFISEDGRVSDVERVKEVIFRGGMEHSLRAEVWKYLLGYFRWDDSKEQRMHHQKVKMNEYFSMKLQWLSMSPQQELNFGGFATRKSQIDKDVQRTDRTIDYFAGDNNANLNRLQDILMTYVMYNFDLGYVQGMSDLLAPILCIMQDEADAFWCFVGFMDMVYTNFDVDQAGMKRQLKDVTQLIALANPRLSNYMKDQQSDNMYVCFRWLLVWFKREFTYFDIMSLWEVLWTGLPCINFHLLVSVAILDDQMDTIISGRFEFNDILKHVNELSFKIDYRHILAKAEAIYLQIKAAEQLNDEVRIIIGEEPLALNSSLDEKSEEDEDSYDNIAPHERTEQELIEVRRKMEEACERSMWNSLY